MAVAAEGDRTYLSAALPSLSADALEWLRSLFDFAQLAADPKDVGGANPQEAC